MICPQRFGAIAILVNNRRHDSIAQGVWILSHVPCCGTRKNVAVVHASTKGLTVISAFGRVIGANAESRISRVGKIDMKQPAFHLR